MPRCSWPGIHPLERAHGGYTQKNSRAARFGLIAEDFQSTDQLTGCFATECSSHLENFCSHSGQIDKQSFVQGAFEELPRNPMVLRIHIVPQDHQLCERCEAVEEDLDAI